MDNEELILWGLAYLAAVITRKHNPKHIADNAVLDLRSSEEFLENEQEES